HLPMYGHGLEVAIDGVRQEQSLPLNIGHGNRGGRFAGKHMDGHPVVLVGRGVNQALLDRARNPAFGGAAEPVDPRGGVAPWLEVHWVRSEAPAAAWSPHWLAYSRFDGIIVTADEMRELPAAAQTAVAQYVECGGALLVAGDWQPPDSWKKRLLPTDPGMRVYYPGFGQCLVHPETHTSPWQHEHWRRLIGSLTAVSPTL